MSGAAGQKSPPDYFERIRSASAIHRFAIWRGFRPGPTADEFIHPDGTRLLRQSGPLPWHVISDGRVLARYLVSEHSITRAGVELEAEAWSHFQQWPHATALICLSDDGRPQEFRGDQLKMMVSGGALSLAPATYRLFKTSTQP